MVDSKQEQIPFLRSFPLLSLSLTFLLGIVFASIFQAALWTWCLLFGLAAASFTFLRRRVSSRTTLLLLAASLLFIGAARFQIAQPHFDDGDLAFYNDLSETVEVRGLVVKHPLCKTRTLNYGCAPKKSLRMERPILLMGFCWPA